VNRSTAFLCRLCSGDDGPSSAATLYDLPGLIDVVGSSKLLVLTTARKFSLRRRVATTLLCVRACDERISCGNREIVLCSGEGLFQ
jgi:hypothetical protein